MADDVNAGGLDVGDANIVDVPAGSGVLRVGLDPEPHLDRPVRESGQIEVQVLPPRRRSFQQSRDVDPARARVDLDNTEIVRRELVPRLKFESGTEFHVDWRADQRSLGQIRIVPAQDGAPNPFPGESRGRAERRKAVFPAGHAMQVGDGPAGHARFHVVFIDRTAVERDDGQIGRRVRRSEGGWRRSLVARVIFGQHGHEVFGRPFHRSRHRMHVLRHAADHRWRADEDAAARFGKDGQSAGGDRLGEDVPGIRRFVRLPAHGEQIIGHVHQFDFAENGGRVVDGRGNRRGLAARAFVGDGQGVVFDRLRAAGQRERTRERGPADDRQCLRAAPAHDIGGIANLHGHIHGRRHRRRQHGIGRRDLDGCVRAIGQAIQLELRT